MNKIIHIALVDDHQLIIDGLTSLLKGNKDIEIAFSTTDPLTVMELLKQHPVDLLIMDVIMPQLSGGILAQSVNEEFPDLKIMALSMNNDGDLVNAMIDNANISGYALKNIGQKEFIYGIKKIMDGGVFFSEAVIEEIDQSQDRKKKLEVANLTSREIEVIKLIEQEHNNREIAQRLNISERTVETHRKNIFRKTNTNSVLGIVKYMYRHKLG